MQTELFQPENQDTSILSVSEITRNIRKSLESQFFQIWVRGEISNLRAHSSGHFYFVLKDTKAQLKTVLFRGDASGLLHPPREGEECLIFGDITVYEPRGDYQLRARHLMTDGMGTLRSNFEKLKKSLLQEGLFEESNKLPLPKLPARIGLVTSADGAAMQDFLSILKRRSWGGEIFLFNSSVQGKDAPISLIEAIKKAQSVNGLELLVITRGGGSLEDLWAFNDEALVRTIYQCKIPTISAIGHQTDFVLTDFVADYRAETPSGAAEWLSSQYLSQKILVNDIRDRMKEASLRFLAKRSEHLNLNKIRLDSASPKSQIEKQEQLLDEFENRLSINLRHRQEKLQDHLESLERRLLNCSLQSILKKGFAYFKDTNGKILSSSGMFEKQAEVEAVLKDGSKIMKVLK